jgi:3-dehydroquinate dehydratase
MDESLILPVEREALQFNRNEEILTKLKEALQEAGNRIALNYNADTDPVETIRDNIERQYHRMGFTEYKVTTKWDGPPSEGKVILTVYRPQSIIINVKRS